MKRFVALAAVCLLFLGLRLSSNGVLDCGYNGEYSVWRKGGQVTTYSSSDMPIIAPQNCIATRLDFVGLASDAFEALKNLSASIKWSENFDGGLVVIYAYSPRILSSRIVNGIKINIMIAINNSLISVGSPILPGSY